MKAFIEAGRAVMGIEFGSTRIKAVLIGERYEVLAQGAHDWENRLTDGVWSYSLEAVEAGMRDAYAKCAADAEAKYGAKITHLAALGISGMMHGYLPFDEAGRQLVPFRTWRNVMTGEAAALLSDLFRFNVPQRWSVAHYAQAILGREAHVPDVRRLTTLAGYVHHRLSGENVLGIGEASGMFPIDVATGDYSDRMLQAFDAKFGGDLRAKLPKVLKAGEKAGVLTERGAKWLDPTGTLQGGAVMAPPEGDAGTGMVATNAVAPKTGNVSAGTSIFAMVVLEKPMKGFHPEIDIVTTPNGHEVAMVHCNNCTNEINAWEELFEEVKSKSEKVKSLSESESEEVKSKSEKVRSVEGNLYGDLFRESLKGDADCGGVVVVPFLSGEPVAGVGGAMLKVVRGPESKFTLANFFRAQIYSAFVSLKLGMDILVREGVAVENLMGHGGIFTTKGVAQQYLADALAARVTCAATASQGGPWGMAILAAYAAGKVKSKSEKVISKSEKVISKSEKVISESESEKVKSESEKVISESEKAKNADLEGFLSGEVFAGAKYETLAPSTEGVIGFNTYAENFKRAIHA